MTKAEPFVHRMPTSLDPALEGPQTIQPDVVEAFLEELERETECAKVREDDVRRVAKAVVRNHLALAALSTPRAQSDVRGFAQTILHGDDKHRAWLLDAAECWVEGREMPPVDDTSKVQTEGFDYEDLAGQFYHHNRWPNPTFKDLEPKHRDWYISATKAIVTHVLTNPRLSALQSEPDELLREALDKIARGEGIGGPDAELQCADIASKALARLEGESGS